MYQRPELSPVCAALCVGLALVPSLPAANANTPSVNASTVALVPRITVTIDGPLALVDVLREVPLTGVDLDLPPGATLDAWEILGPERLVLHPQDVAAAGKRHADFLRASGLPPVVSFAEEADYHFSFAGVPKSVAGVPKSGLPLRVHYRFTAPLSCQAGRFVLSMPGALDGTPVSPEVVVTFVRRSGAGPSQIEIAGVAVPRATQGALRIVAGKVPARAPWELSFAWQGLPFAALATAARVANHQSVISVGLCRPEAKSLAPMPGRVAFVIDRSRSVGASGLAAQHELALGILEALPPAVRFNAVFFDRGPVRLFPVERQATREALTALHDAMLPASLSNGSDLAAAVALALADLGAAANTANGPAWLFILTDGALGDSDAPEALFTRLPAHLRTLQVAVLVVRPEADDPAPASTLARLAGIGPASGGILRQVSERAISQSVSDVVTSLRGGGDVFFSKIRLQGSGAGGAKRPEATFSASAIAAGRGAFVRVVDATSPMVSTSPAVTISSRWGGRDVSLSVPITSRDKRWSPVRSVAAGASTWYASARNRSALLAARVSALAPPSGSGRGQMDREVVRNALSLAYLPRARACYLSRPVRNADDLDLRGRVRIELSLERGEMRDAAVASSSLHRPEIEACLREAAFAIDVPRAMRSDASVVAILNLVFAPRTRPPSTDASLLDREIDILLGPITFSGDREEPPSAPRR